MPNATVLRFTLLGPLIGGLVFPVAKAASETPPGNLADIARVVIGGVFVGVVGLFISFPLGLLPAWVAGQLFEKIKQQSDIRFSKPLARAILGSVVGAGVTGLYGGVLFSYREAWMMSAFVTWLVTGTLAGAVCGMVAPRSEQATDEL
jgi:uncharacterized membrane protein YeaQ/YmgE (transglycosylase-associated protein family)